MKQCSHCEGFVPQGILSCPHCEGQIVSDFSEKSQSPRRYSWKQRLAATVGTGAMMLTLMACYGGPPPTGSCDAVDKDGDGYFVCKTGASGSIGNMKFDCDDSDKTINDGAKNCK